MKYITYNILHAFILMAIHPCLSSFIPAESPALLAAGADYDSPVAASQELLWMQLVFLIQPGLQE